VEERILRRSFVRLLVLLSAVLAILPFSPILEYLAPAVSANIERRKVGNVNELIPNSYKIFFYPGDRDPYHTNMLIRLQDGRFRAFNRVCVHLQCLVTYQPQSTHPRWKGQPTIGPCPCHGSVYRPTDAAPIEGPALQIGRGLPLLKLEIDMKTGDIYVAGMLGNIGYGRYVNDKTDPLEPVRV